MPHSYSFGKKEAIEFVQKNFPSSSKILDVGPGVGTYYDLLKPYGYKLDCLEIYEGYVDAYNLKSKYDQTLIGDVREEKWNLDNYDLVILGDVLEHLTVEQSKKVLNRCQNVLVAVPYLCPQGGVDFVFEDKRLINPHEKHEQADLTPLVMLTRYPNLGLIWSNHLYGYYSNVQWTGYYKEKEWTKL
jgi:hypothetical protein